MAPLLITAFLMGMLGSFHCVGMCGPLALSVPIDSESESKKMIGALIYNLGRIITYSFFGLLIGFFGKSMSFFGIQQWLSILGGGIILMYVYFKKIGFVNKKIVFPKIFEWVRNQLGKYFFKRNLFAVFMIGLLNGFLPCGFVYLAFAGALATNNITNSILFMAFFGMGTLPIMWSLIYFGHQVPITLIKTIKQIYPYMMTCMAILLILRGMGLGVPFLSPKYEVTKNEIHSCCHKK